MIKATLRRHLLACAPEKNPERPLLSLSQDASGIRDINADQPSPCTETSLKSWFDPLDMDFNPEGPVLSVCFPHSFFGQRFLQLYRPFFEHAAYQIWGQDLTILYASGNTTSRYISRTSGRNDVPSVSHENHPLSQSVRENSPLHADSALAPLSGDVLPHAVSRLQNTFSLSPSSNPFPYGEEWTFDTFIANGKHKWAMSLIREVTRKATVLAASSHPKQEDPPGILVLCGQHGTGKTHILRAMGNELSRTALAKDLLYISLGELELLFASSSPPVVRQGLAEKGAILIDDFQYLSRIPEFIGKNTISEENGVCFQDELCLLIDRFMDQGKLLVIAGVGHPRDWNLHRALQSRLETGLWSELPEPDLDIRLRYVQQQVRQKRLPLLREQMMLLAQHCLDIRKLSGVIRRVVSHRSLVGHDLTEQDILDIIRQSGDRSPLTAQQIVSIVGEYCGVSPRDILGTKRHPDMVQARQLAMFLCRELLGHAYPVIGRMFGGKDHSTVMHSVKKIKALQENDRIIHTMVTELTKACRERRD